MASREEARKKAYKGHNKQGHLLGRKFTEEGYALCSLCGARGDEDSIHEPCPNNQENKLLSKV